MRYDFIREIIQKKLKINLEDEIHLDEINNIESDIDDMKFSILMLAEGVFWYLQYMCEGKGYTRSDYLELTNDILSALVNKIVYDYPEEIPITEYYDSAEENDDKYGVQEVDDIYFEWEYEV